MNLHDRPLQMDKEDRAFQAESKVKMGRERTLLMCTTILGQAGNEQRLWQSDTV